MTALINLVGQKFGRLVILECVGRTERKLAIWRAQCDCGNIIDVDSNRLRTGNTASCGCLRLELSNARFTKHGEANKSPEYICWWAMKTRCLNKNHKWYKNYGGRGIAVCKEWLESYPQFLADVGRRPSSRHTLDRVDNDGDYEPMNVRWATRKEQANNRRPKGTSDDA